MHKRFVFFGTPYVGRDTLAALVAHEYMPALVVTAPDAPKGRGQKLTPCETKVWALEHGLPVITPEKITPQVVEEIQRAHGAYGIVVAYGKILPDSLIRIFPQGLINVHYSLLPKYRGASPVESALLAGETKTGVSIQTLVKELDAGDILAEEETPIFEDETTRELRPRLVTIGAELLIRILPSFENGTLPQRAQNHSEATHCRKIQKEDGLLSSLEEHEENWKKYRAYAESPGTYFFFEKNGTKVRIKIKTASYKEGKFVPLRVVPEGKKEVDFEPYRKS